MGRLQYWNSTTFTQLCLSPTDCTSITCYKHSFLLLLMNLFQVVWICSKFPESLTSETVQFKKNPTNKQQQKPQTKRSDWSSFRCSYNQYPAIYCSARFFFSIILNFILKDSGRREKGLSNSCKPGDNLSFCSWPWLYPDLVLDWTTKVASSFFKKNPIF